MQIKLLKIASDGLPTEFDSANDEITLASFSAGAGPTVAIAGIDMNNTDISEVQDLNFLDPATATINQTIGNLVIDDIMAKDRENLMSTAGGIAFPVVSNVAGEVDSFRLPAITSVPSATPTNGGSGHLLFNSSNGHVYLYNGTLWDDLSTVSSAESIENSFDADVAIGIRDVVYISTQDKVSPASASSEATARVIGFASNSATAGQAVSVKSDGLITGFSGLTSGARYYLATTAGQISTTVPVGTGNIIHQCGYSKNATTLKIQFQNLGRRA
jgi:hypothetical protein